MVSYETISEACPHLKIFRQINERSAFDELCLELVDGCSLRADAETLASPWRGCALCSSRAVTSPTGA